METESREPEIIYSDQHVVVVNKPSGMLSVPGKGGAVSVSDFIRTTFPDCISHPAVHRLDMDTSGLMVLGLDALSQKALSRQFQERQVNKTYLALLNGLLQGVADGDTGEIELPFRLDVDNRPVQIYDEVHGKIGNTQWKKLGVEGERTRVEYRPLTGRTHQLRVHSAHPKGMGVPIVGDTLYGGHDKHGELCLHAQYLEFRHPITEELLEFYSPAMF